MDRLSVYGISKEDAEKKMAVLGMDGKTGVKALIQKQQGIQKLILHWNILGGFGSLLFSVSII